MRDGAGTTVKIGMFRLELAKALLIGKLRPFAINPLAKGAKTILRSIVRVNRLHASSKIAQTHFPPAMSRHRFIQKIFLFCGHNRPPESAIELTTTLAIQAGNLLAMSPEVID
nr:hypothetical protein [Sulfuritortus calidifontis]